MNVNFKSSRRMASALLLSLVLAGCASGPSAPSREMLQRIEAARTRGDHEALAAHYDREAAAARVIAADHLKMARSYLMVPLPRTSRRAPIHCESIARSQEGIAAEYEGMAEEHRQLAKQAQP